MEFSVRQACSGDTAAIAAIHRESFPRQRDSKEWVEATLAASPRMLVYVLMQGEEVSGYIFWAQKSGIRPAAVVELDQIAVQATLRGQGLGELLIIESLVLLREKLSGNNQSLKSILVSTRADNAAQRLYRKTLGARVVARIRDLYSATEVFMTAQAEDQHTL